MVRKCAQFVPDLSALSRVANWFDVEKRSVRTAIEYEPAARSLRFFFHNTTAPRLVAAASRIGGGGGPLPESVRVPAS
jgi:hypothetical protein